MMTPKEENKVVVQEGTDTTNGNADAGDQKANGSVTAVGLDNANKTAATAPGTKTDATKVNPVTNKVVDDAGKAKPVAVDRKNRTAVQANGNTGSSAQAIGDATNIVNGTTPKVEDTKKPGDNDTDEQVLGDGSVVVDGQKYDGTQTPETSMTEEDLETSGMESDARMERDAGNYIQRIGKTMYPTEEEEKAKKAHEQNVKAYNDFINTIYKKPETAEERKAREKLERNGKMWTSIGDGISALANLWYTTKGSPNAFTKESALTPKMQERYDKLKKERDAADKEWMAGQAQILANEQNAINDMAARRKEEREALKVMQDLETKRNAEASRAVYYKDKAAYEAAYMALQSADAETRKQAQEIINSLNLAKTRESNARANKVNSGGSASNTNKFDYLGVNYPSAQARDARIISDYRRMGGQPYVDGHLATITQMRQYNEDKIAAQKANAGGSGNGGGNKPKGKTGKGKTGKGKNTKKLGL